MTKDNNILKFDLSEDVKKRLDYDIKGYQMMHGLTIRTLDRMDSSDLCRTLPVTLHPSPFPRKIFQQAMDVQMAMNELQFRVSMDRQFLCEAMADVARNDEFTRRFLDIYNRVMQEGLAQKFVCQVQRADYMCHCPPDSAHEDNYSLKQIEVNTFAAGGTGWAGNLTELHRRNLRKLGVHKDLVHSNVPANVSATTACGALQAAWRCYGSVSGIILMVTEQDDPVANEFWLIERLLKERINDTIRMEKISLRLDSHRLSLDEATKTLYLDGTKEVGVVYYMGAGDEKDFDSEAEWQALLQMERSRAVKCPFIGIQLADNKKIQQMLSKPGILERFFPDDAQTVQAIRDTFVGQWGLDRTDQETHEVIERAKRQPMKFVMKSQREGGHGVNYFGPIISEQLAEMDSKELATYVLMERLYAAPINENYILRPLQPMQKHNCNSELGVFGYLVGDTDTGKVVDNRVTGHMLKTKPDHVNEAGIAKGTGALDTVYLID